MSINGTEHIRCECTECNETVYIANASNAKGIKFCMNCGEEGIEVYHEDEGEAE